MLYKVRDVYELRC